MKLKNWNYPYEKKIIAIDFDGTITTKDNRIWNKEKYKHDIMFPRYDVIKKLLNVRDKYYFILWTNRHGKALRDAVSYCKRFGLEFDAVNKNIVPFKSSRKIVADYYLDDKSLTIDKFLGEEK